MLHKRWMAVKRLKQNATNKKVWKYVCESRLSVHAVSSIVDRFIWYYCVINCDTCNNYYMSVRPESVISPLWVFHLFFPLLKGFFSSVWQVFLSGIEGLRTEDVVQCAVCDLIWFWICWWNTGSVAPGPSFQLKRHLVLILVTEKPKRKCISGLDYYLINTVNIKYILGFNLFSKTT